MWIINSIFVKLLPSASQRTWLLVKSEIGFHLFYRQELTQRNGTSQRVVKA